MRSTSGRQLGAAIAALVLLGLTSWRVGAQSARVGPARPGGDPHSLSTTSFPLSIFPFNGSSQQTTVTIGAGSILQTTNFTVLNADFVDVKLLGFTGVTSTANCMTLDSSGNLDILTCNAVWVTTSKVNATTIALTARRYDIGDGTISTMANIGVTDLNPIFVDSVARGTVDDTSDIAFTACPGGLTATDLREIGTSGFILATGQRLSLSNSTHVNAFNNPGLVGTSGWQVICWKFHP
jgi:hypothetical protein